MSVTFTKKVKLSDRFKEVRGRTEDICRPLKNEDYVVRPAIYVSPPKWHLGYTTWFFENYVLKPNLIPYKEFDKNYNFVFNSHYETAIGGGLHTDRGNLSRPTVEEIYEYRAHVDVAMYHMLDMELPVELEELVLLGLNYEEQHQERLFTDIKYILGHNPLLPAYNDKVSKKRATRSEFVNEFIAISQGLYDIGYDGNEFCFDNELGRHSVYLQKFKIAWQQVTNEEYLEFMNAGGYDQPEHWHTEGYDWLKKNNITAPLYWYRIDGLWHNYTLNGLKPVDMSASVCHVSFYEAAAFAAWKGMRLPTEFEWEAAARELDWGARWEWTNSVGQAYPEFKKMKSVPGALDANATLNQMVLRGASEVTPHGHSRTSYRNFLRPDMRWQYTGIRLAK